MSRLMRLLIGLIRTPLMWWVKTSKVQDDPAATLQLDPDKPVCYILPFPSIADEAVLERVCKESGLPVPRALGIKGLGRRQAASVFLPPFKGRSTARYQSLISNLIAEQGPAPDSEVQQGDETDSHQLEAQKAAKKGLDIQIVPVSVFWGRNPGKETSLFKIMFSDSIGAGILRRIFIVLANGRNSLVSFSKPLDFSALIADDMPTELAAQKLVRVLRVHFRRQRAATLGPSLSLRGRMVSAVLAQPMVQEAIREEAAAVDQTVEETQQKAQEYVEEIAADYSNAAINFAFRALNWLFGRVYNDLEVEHTDRMRETARDFSVVYVPAHRSHLDYLLISYLLRQIGLVPPHIAAGINLNMPVIGPFLRKLGAFFIRRSFDGNRLYTAVFKGYCDVLVQRGYSLQFFPEGGRSRTGRLLPPKTGMVSMLVQTCMRNPSKPVVFVPVYVGYDKVMEVDSYFSELEGTTRKRKESLMGVIRALRILKMNFGRAYIAFGTPIPVHDYLDEVDPQWRGFVREHGPDAKPEWLRTGVGELAQRIMIGLNQTAVLNPSGAVTTMLLAAPQHAIAEDELAEQVEGLQQLLERVPYHADTTVLRGSGAAMLAETETIHPLRRTAHEWGDIISIEGKTAVVATYCRNSVLHLIALPGLVASFFMHRETLSRSRLITACEEIYPFLQTELFLGWPESETKARVAAVIDAMCDLGYLQEKADGVLQRPGLAEMRLAALIGLGHVLRDTLERYCLSSILLAETPDGKISRDAFERRCQLLAGRLAVLNGRRAPEFFDRRLFAGFLETLKAKSLVREIMEDDQAVLEIDNQLRIKAEGFMAFMDVEIQQRVRRLIALPVAES